MMATIYFVVIGLGVILCLLRMLKGPTAPDLVLKRRIYLDVSLVYAVLTFIGSVAIARYLEGGIE